MDQSRKPVVGAVGSILVLVATMLGACAPDVAHAANVAAAALAQAAGENAEGAATGVGFLAAVAKSGLHLTMGLTPPA